MKTETLGETDYYRLNLVILHPPARELSPFDDDKSSRLELRRKAADGSDVGLVQQVSIQDSQLYGRQHPIRERLRGKRPEKVAVDLQQNDLRKQIKRLAEIMYKLENKMQQKLAYYRKLLPQLQNAAEEDSSGEKMSEAAE